MEPPFKARIVKKQGQFLIKISNDDESWNLKVEKMVNKCGIFTISHKNKNVLHFTGFIRKYENSTYLVIPPERFVLIQNILNDDIELTINDVIFHPDCGNPI